MGFYWLLADNPELHALPELRIYAVSELKKKIKRSSPMDNQIVIVGCPQIFVLPLNCHNLQKLFIINKMECVLSQMKKYSYIQQKC